MKPKLIIFDFDGTIADTSATILWTFRRAIAKLELPPRSDEEYRATIGLPLKEGFRQLYPSLSEPQLDNCLVVYRRIFTDNMHELVPHLFAGVKETLDLLGEHGILMAIASSRSRASLVEFCSAMGILEFFTLILGADDVCRAKPDPEPVNVILRRMEISQADAVVVGDMPVDIAMGRGAGCVTIGVSYGNSSRQGLLDAGADYVADSFPELMKFFL